MSNMSIVMPCHNRAHDLRRVLSAYENQTSPPVFEVIAVDDASEDETYNLLIGYHPKNFTLRVVRQEYNQGPAAARNQGIALAKSPLVLFVGDDIRPTPNFVESHFEAHRRHPAVEDAILGRIEWAPDIPQNTLMKHIDGMGAQQFSYYYLEDQHEYDFRHLYTANVSLKTAFIKQEPRWFDADFPFAAIEDAEFAYRLSKRGLRIIYDRQPLGYHYHYHTLWTFSMRQYRAGLMVCEFAKKHPELADFLRVTRTKQLRWLGTLQRLNRFSSKLADIARWLEEQTLHLGSAYEWTQHHLLDDLYLVILEYFWRKGLVEGTFQKSKQRDVIRDTYAIYYLKPRLIDFLRRAQMLDIPVPILTPTLLHTTLAEVESPFVRWLQTFWQTIGYRWASPWLMPEAPPA